MSKPVKMLPATSGCRAMLSKPAPASLPMPMPEPMATSPAPMAPVKMYEGIVLAGGLPPEWS